MSDLNYLGKKYIVFSDFDGTITQRDSNDWLTDNLGFGKAKRRQGNLDILSGKATFRQIEAHRDAFRGMLESVNEKYEFEECRKQVTQAIELDPGFKDYFAWAQEANVPTVIVSSGMDQIIRSIFANLVGEEDASKIEIIANSADIKPDGHFQIKYRHPESPFGHDKSKALRPYAQLPADQRPTIFFCGDGVSDMSAAGESDVLFVKVVQNGSNDLAKHCLREKIPFLPFISFTSVRDIVKQVVEGKITVHDINSGRVKMPAEAEAAAISQPLE